MAPPRKSERLVNLVICLLAARRFITRQQIRASVEGYADLTEVSFQRTFERDKEELRRLGVPLEVGPTDVWSDEADGYRIRRSDFELPPLNLSAAESTLLGLATRVWQEAALAEATGRALTKLRAAGAAVVTDRLVAVTPSLPTREPAFGVMWQGWMTRTPVEFRYHGRVRQVEPWKLALRQGRWYVLGRDRALGPRWFKLARIEDAPRLLAGRPAFEAVDPAELAEHVRRLEGPEPTGQARIALRPEGAPALRRRGRRLEEAPPVGLDEFVVFAVPYARDDEIVAEAAAAGADAVVLAPVELRAQVITRLTEVAGCLGEVPVGGVAVEIRPQDGAGGAPGAPFSDEARVVPSAGVVTGVAPAVGFAGRVPGGAPAGDAPVAAEVPVPSLPVSAVPGEDRASTLRAGGRGSSGSVTEEVPAAPAATENVTVAAPSRHGVVPESAADQVARLLLLIPYLQNRPGVRLAEAAAAFATTPDQIRRDLAVAFLCGLPGGLPGDLIEVDLELVDDEGVIYLTNAAVLNRPLTLTLDEAMGLIVALQAVREVAAASLHPVIDSLLAKLGGVVPGAPDAPLVTLPAGSAEVRERLGRAISSAQRVELTYDGLARGVTSRPTVDPVRLFVADGVAYLSAWSLGRGDWRTYRLDRIAAVRPTGQAAVAHGDEPAADAWPRTLAAARPVRLIARPSAAWIAEYYPVSRRELLPSGDLDLTLPVAEPAWLRWLILRLGSQIEVLDAPDVVAEAAAAARRALAVYAAVAAEE